MRFYAYKKQETTRTAERLGKTHTWFFSGEGGRKEYTVGVGMIISNKFMQYIEDIEPINDRLMYAILRGTVECNIICTYASSRKTEVPRKTY